MIYWDDLTFPLTPTMQFDRNGIGKLTLLVLFSWITWCAVCRAVCWNLVSNDSEVLLIQDDSNLPTMKWGTAVFIYSPKPRNFGNELAAVRVTTSQISSLCDFSQLLNLKHLPICAIGSYLAVWCCFRRMSPKWGNRMPMNSRQHRLNRPGL